MPDTPQTNGERHIERIMEDLDPGSERYQVLATAKRFKSSWVELGEQLIKVNTRTLYREWGYQSFEDYCLQEVRIKKPTAEKLTLAYRFMERQEPQYLAQKTPLKPLPDFRSVDLLRQAREEKNFSEEEYAELKKNVFEDERSHPTILKRFKEVAKGHDTEPADPLAPIRASLACARRLDTVLSGVAGLAPHFREQLGTLITHLADELEGGKAATEPG